MKAVCGHRPLLPKELLKSVDRYARQLGRRVAGDDLVLLALSELPEGSPSRRALEAAGLDTGRIVAEIRTHGDGDPERGGGLQFAPAFYSMQGRAEGLAAALGDGEITNEHVLVALVWDPMSQSSQVLWRLGASRGQIMEELRGAGIPIPRATLPPQREIEIGKRVWIERDQVDVVLPYVARHVPPGTMWGFNYADDRAWLNAEAHVELRDLVDQALSE